LSSLAQKWTFLKCPNPKNSRMVFSEIFTLFFYKIFL
jgi:hypothetical protein